MTDATELLPCPFCGGDAEIVDAVEAGSQAKVVCCKKCMCSSRVVFALMDDVTFDLVSAWNARADLARPMTVAEAAKVLIAEINRPATQEDKPDWRYLSRLDMPSLRALSQGGG